MKIAIVGAGVSGATIAYELANHGYNVDVFESRDHIAGNCHTYRDPASGVMVHTYGPHIFHTNSARVWAWVNQFAEFIPFNLRPKAVVYGQVFSFPINLLTMAQVYGGIWTPEKMRKKFAQMTLSYDPQPMDTFEGAGRMAMGDDLYQMFFAGYTQKQWGISPHLLPASVFHRIPVRFDYDDRAHAHDFQGIPLKGYTYAVENMLGNPRITTHLSCGFGRAAVEYYDHVFYTGPIDAWFEHVHGRLGYRTLQFKQEMHPGDYQGTAVMNYCDKVVSWTRIVEHKHFAPWEEHGNTIVSKEFSRPCLPGDEPFYPIRLAGTQTMLDQYLGLAAQENNVTFLGRLARYQYLDMDMAIGDALNIADRFIKDRT